MAQVADTTPGTPGPSAPTSRCAAEPVEQTRYLFVDKFQKPRIDAGETPAERAVFRKQHGAARARVDVNATCPAGLRYGIWQGGPYETWVRWSSDAPPDTPDDRNSTLGVALKMFGASGRTLASDDTEASTADLLFQNSDVFFVDDAFGMCSITADFDGYVASHGESARILAEMSKHEDTLLGAVYWSTLPYALGDAVIKYRLRPAGPQVARPPVPGARDYLSEDLRAGLSGAPAVFSIEVQRFVDDENTPVDRATVRWEETVSPFTPIATLTVDMQDIAAPGQALYGDGLAFSPWRVPYENRPLGTIGLSRRIAYPSSAALRRSCNGIPNQEPRHPR